MIDKDILIIDLLQKYPEAMEFLQQHGMGCSQCLGASRETLEEAAKVHGLDVETLLNDLNSFLK